MNQIIANCFPNSFKDFCDAHCISKEEQEFAKDFIKNTDGIENLYKLEMINNSLNYTFSKNLSNYFSSRSGYQLYQINDDSKEESKPLLAQKEGGSENESEYSSNWLMTSQSIDTDLIRTNPKMIMEELEPKVILNKEKLIINAAGLINGARNSNDGFAFFGSSLKNSSGNIINDFAITITHNKKTLETINKSNHNNSTTDDHLFVIYFKKSNRHYYLRSFINSKTLVSSILLKLGDISSPYKIKQNEFLMIGDMMFKLRTESSGELIIVKLPNHKYPEQIILKYQMEQGQITIGRDRSCSIPFPTEINLSKTHCTFEYIERYTSWVVYDGGVKESTNGTWIMPRHSVDITKGCTFKLLGTSKFVLYPLPC